VTEGVAETMSYRSLHAMAGKTMIESATQTLRAGRWQVHPAVRLLPALAWQRMPKTGVSRVRG
jgi:hypothetical protein